MDFFIQLVTDPIGFYSAHQLLISQIGINALLTLSMYVTLNCGLLTLANVGFMAIGAYVSVLLGLNLHLPFLLTLFVGGITAALVSLPIGLPVLRLSGIFLAIATIGFGQVVVGAILNIPITGEGQGVTNLTADPGTAIIEVAVHKGFETLDIVPHVLTALTVVDPSGVHVVKPADIPNANWLSTGIPSAGQQDFGTTLLAAHKFIVIPSAVSKNSWNLIFVGTAAAGAYQLRSQEKFALDTRLNPVKP